MRTQHTNNMLVNIHTSHPTIDYNLATYLSRLGYVCSTGTPHAQGQAFILVHNKEKQTDATHTPHQIAALTIEKNTNLHILADKIAQLDQAHHSEAQYLIELHPSLIFNTLARVLLHTPSQAQQHLTEKEAEILAYLYAHASASKEELLTKIWHYHAQADSHTLESHIYKLRQKIAELSDTIEIAHEQGRYKITTNP